MKKVIKILFVCSLFICTQHAFAQEALKSIEEEYYDFLSLTGLVERPTLGYRTLSDSVWNFNDVESFEENGDGTFTKVRMPGNENDGNLWKKNNLGTTYTLWEPATPAENWFAHGIKQGITARIYGPEWFNSYNSAVPYGQNDGGLWQGRGYNTALTTGARLEAYGFELTFKPQLSFSQNKEFDFIRPIYNGELYKDKAEKYGYYGVPSVDAPQRFGDKAFWNFDWGDTEIRYTWNSFTFGFGTEIIWLGPSKLNSIIHSNNAASYPKVDIGLRKTNLRMPYFGWDLGYIEARGWWGKLTESKWFDNDDDNNHNLISGLAFYYQFPFLKELTIGFNRTMVSKFNNISPYTLFDIFVPFMETKAGVDDSDGRASVVIDYKNSLIGMNLYFEWGRNDFQTAHRNFIRYPFHTEGWTFGVIKTLDFTDTIRGELNVEITDVECSQDYGRTDKSFCTFYSHHKITQGYTNKGQWLGPGIGTGGNSQYLGFKLYYPKGYTKLFINRFNPDLDYYWFINVHPYTTDASEIQTYIVFGLQSCIYFMKNIQFNASVKPIYILSKNGTNLGESFSFNCDSTIKILF